MRVAVIGAGIVGVSTAFMLAQKGLRVVLIDEAPEPARGTSYANGGQLCYNYVAPLAGPGVIGKLPVWLTDSESPVLFKPQWDWHQWIWCAKFLLRCNSKASLATTEKLLVLSMLSKKIMLEVIRQHGPDFDYNRKGKLVVYSSRSTFKSARQQVALQKNIGSPQIVISATECLGLEPSLRPIHSRLEGGIFTADDHTGDARKFAAFLVDQLEKKIRYMPNTKVHCLSTAGKRVTGLLTNRGEIQADHYVVANGVAANDLLRPLGLALPIYPIRGYSLTAKLLPAQLPKMSFTDYDKRVVYAPLGDRLRIAGMADIAGYDITPDSPRANTLLKEARNIFPLPASPSTLSPWCGLRPATPDGVPVFGATRLPNLSLNVGHGALGWTLAMATAHLTVEDIVNRQPQL